MRRVVECSLPVVSAASWIWLAWYTPIQSSGMMVIWRKLFVLCQIFAYERMDSLTEQSRKAVIHGRVYHIFVTSLPQKALIAHTSVYERNIIRETLKRIIGPQV